MRSDFLTFRDVATAPNLTALAEGGTTFTSAWSGSSWTLPGHAQMFTGMPPALHGVEYDDVAIDPGHTTLPEALQEAGWFTAGWWTGWYLADEYGFARGFDIYRNAMEGGSQVDAAYRAAVERGDLAQVAHLHGSRGIASHQMITSPNVVAGLERTVANVDPDQDLFLFVHLFDPHYDYIPPAPYDTKFDPDYDGDLSPHDFYGNPAIYDATAPPPRRRISDRDLDHVRARYRGEIAYTEDQVARMLAALEDAGRLDEALVVVTSDHGEEFFEHGNRGHRQGLHDEVLHVPLLVRPPASAAAAGGSVAAEVDAMVGLQDLLPTILDFAGLEPPASAVGRSLRGAVLGAPLDDEPQLGSLLQYDPGQGHLMVDSYRTREGKLIRFVGVGDDRVPELLADEVYDLGRDPGELDPRRSVVGQADHPLWLALEERMAELRGVHGALGPAPRSQRQTAISDVFAADLGDLGYADVSDGDTVGTALPWPPGPKPPVRTGDR